MNVKFHWYDTMLVIENPTKKMEKSMKKKVKNRVFATDHPRK